MPFGNETWIRPQQAVSLLPSEAGERSASVLERPGLQVKIYAPRGLDPQGPHTRDEVYVVISGTGMFRNGDRTHSFAPGDLMFVPAGVEHRFESFSDDLAVWVVFVGEGQPRP
ncbi:MAG TPA: cupin domain-containing protein [Anaerolineales bacterium]|nr:cupin domain-containing protein [Anaerolineales bacterium]